MKRVLFLLVVALVLLSGCKHARAKQVGVLSGDEIICNYARFHTLETWATDQDYVRVYGCSFNGSRIAVRAGEKEDSR